MKILDIILREIGIFNYLKKEDKGIPGLLLPTQSELGELSTLDEVTATVAPVNWKSLELDKIPTYPMYSQDGSGSCVAHSWSLIASILYKQRTGNAIKFSPAWLYQQRVNKATMGMIGTDVAKIASDGMLPHDLMPCMDMGEVAINTIPTYPWYKDVAKVFATEDKLIQLPIGDLESVVSTMQATGKPVNVWYSFTRDEWNGEPIAKAVYPDLRHSVVAIDYGIYKEQKCVVVQDSWGNTSTQYQGRRIITEDFHKKRNLFAGYPRRFKFDVPPLIKPTYNGSTESLQDCLRYEGLFPTNIESTGFYGKITTDAVKAFQKKYSLKVTGILTSETKKLLLANYK